MINLKENVEITFLKSLQKRQDIQALFKVKKNIKLKITDEGNFDHINNKEFETIYISQNAKYIVRLKGFHILYILLYYLYIIHQNVQLVNKNHYSHGSLLDILNKLKLVDDAILRYNKLTKEISEYGK